MTAVGGWMVKEYRNMFDVVAMAATGRRKPARLCFLEVGFASG